MIESSKKEVSLPPFPRIKSRHGTAVIFQYLGYKQEVMLLKCLSRGTANYLVKNEQTLDHFWTIARRVKFSKKYIGNVFDYHHDGDFATGSEFHLYYHDGDDATESVFPSPKT